MKAIVFVAMEQKQLIGVYSSLDAARRGVNEWITFHHGKAPLADWDIEPNGAYWVWQDFTISARRVDVGFVRPNEVSS